MESVWTAAPPDDALKAPIDRVAGPSVAGPSVAGPSDADSSCVLSRRRFFLCALPVPRGPGSPRASRARATPILLVCSPGASGGRRRRLRTMSGIKGALQRLAKEAAAIASAPPPFVPAAPVDDDNLFVWRAVLAGTYGSAIEGVAIVLDLTFPPDCPVNPPNAGFLTPVPCPSIGARPGPMARASRCSA
jgi:hypothetical protein